jgi:hypothetical protein
MMPMEVGRCLSIVVQAVMMATTNAYTLRLSVQEYFKIVLIFVTILVVESFVVRKACFFSDWWFRFYSTNIYASILLLGDSATSISAIKTCDIEEGEQSEVEVCYEPSLQLPEPLANNQR